MVNSSETAAIAAKKASAVFIGPAGQRSTAIIAENARKGTTSWQIENRGQGFIEGFATTTYAARGDRVHLYVSTSAPRFRVIAYRMGWYRGAGARKVWQSAFVVGRRQPPCTLTRPVNMVSCTNWTRSLSMLVTRDFVPGDYLLKLVGSDHQQSYVLLTIWNPDSRATYLVMARSLTEQGWNDYGGYDLYAGKGPCQLDSNKYPPCNRARVVSFDRPMATGNGASDFLADEYPFVQFAERHGLDVSYVTDVTVDEHASIVLAHRAVISLGHDETWTYAELRAVQRGIDHGVNVAFLSAAAIVRHARLQRSSFGVDRQMVDYRDSSEDPLKGHGNPMEVTGNTWASPPTNFSVSRLTGQLYSGYVYDNKTPSPFIAWTPSAWIFQGTGFRVGSKIFDVIGSDIDHVDPALPTPANLEVLGHSPVPLTHAYTNQGSWGGYTYSDMTYWSSRTSYAGVFDAGTVNWIGAMVACPKSDTQCPQRWVEKITGNLLRLFGRGPAGRVVPSIATKVVPEGS